VNNFRDASKKLRQLKEGYHGSVVNPSLRLQHSNTMREAANRLEMLGHKEIAALLGKWHAALTAARRETSEDAHSSRCWARSLSGQVNREVERIR